jgi:hypothetical protein
MLAHLMSDFLQMTELQLIEPNWHKCRRHKEEDHLWLLIVPDLGDMEGDTIQVALIIKKT